MKLHLPSYEEGERRGKALAQKEELKFLKDLINGNKLEKDMYWCKTAKERIATLKARGKE